MAIPSQSAMFYVVLKLVRDLPCFTRRQMKQLVCDTLRLSEAERNEKTGSGAPIYSSRVGWAISWLSDAKYVERTERATYRITNRGKEVLELGLSDKEFTALLRKDRLIVMSGAEPNAVIQSEDNESEQIRSPEEIMDETLQTMNTQLANSLISEILKVEGRQGDTFFEKLVTDLIEKMGYGEGRVTPASFDGGIDGIVTTDRLGFDPIKIQAKRYSMDNPVGRPEVQSFAGALGSTTRGAFITTSTFSLPAIDFAKNYPHATILLIDGRKLAQLMIEYNVGVSEERVIRIKRIDNDYFDI